ncbi:hypothetical protein Agabi119p4_9770 [Agaricus bisporus var. burnettii]|uniref:Uncharacterized protein n=1 Tax=Agaricus bisporus var. burnettii TaxID=192524 RepID=A0A8H7C4A2_AGABI|nr:hypothetical protein Agabi119p4_9770 [Agaricus bisporus var. burnettii]
MSFTLPQQKQRELLAEINRFVFAKRSPRHTLKEFQTLAGWMNWAFNVFPLLRPCLSNIYAKIWSLTDSSKRVTVSRAKKHISRSSGVHLLEARDWSPDDGDVIVYTDACLTGLAFYLPSYKMGYHADVPPDVPSEWIFYHEKWAVLSAIHHIVVQLKMTNEKIVVYTDNINTVDVYNTLYALPFYNPLLQNAIDLLLSSHCQICVLYVPTEQNQIADALSRHELERALSLVPDLIILDFQPPRNTLGEDQQ